MTLLARVPGFLQRGFGMPAVEYRVGKSGSWLALGDASFPTISEIESAPDEHGRQVMEIETMLIIPHNGPALAKGDQVRIGGDNGKIFAVRNPVDGAHVGFKKFLLQRENVEKFTSNRGQVP